MVLPLVLDLPLKGGRDYVHGTDLFDALLTRFQPSPPLSLRIHSVIRGLIDVRPWQVGQQRPAGLLIYTDSARNPVILGLNVRQRGTNPIRIPFDEDAVAEGYQLHDQAIEIAHRDDSTLIERWIVLNKLLHRHLLSNNGGRWIFARIDLSILPKTVNMTELIFKDRIGTRLTKVAIKADGDLIGDLYFSLVLAEDRSTKWDSVASSQGKKSNRSRPC